MVSFHEKLKAAHENLTDYNKWDHETRPETCPWEKLRVAHLHLNQRPWDFTIDPETWELALKGYNSAFGKVGKDDASLALEFEKIDPDNTGSVDRAELEAYLKEVHGDKFDQKTIDAMMKAADANNDNRVDFDEFKAIVRSGPDTKPSVFAMAVQGGAAAFQNTFGGIDQSDEALDKAFESCDVDKSGTISADEMTKYIKKMYGEDVDPKVLEGMMQAADKDQNGQIDQDEFKAIMRSGPKSKRGTARVSVSDATLSWQAGFKHVDKSDAGLEKAFREVDKDNTGFMDPEELTAYIGKVYGVRLAPNILEEMMAEADGNADGQVDLEEFKAIMRKGPDRPPGPMDNLPKALDDLNPFKGFKSVFGGVDLSDKGLEDAFKGLDTDGSGKCSNAELEAYIRKVHKKKLGPEAIASMMAEADTDKDGEVDLEEFKLIMRGAPKAEKLQAQKAAANPNPNPNPNPIMNPSPSPSLSPSPSPSPSPYHVQKEAAKKKKGEDDPIAYATKKAKDEALAAGRPAKEASMHR